MANNTHVEPVDLEALKRTLNRYTPRSLVVEAGTALALIAELEAARRPSPDMIATDPASVLPVLAHLVETGQATNAQRAELAAALGLQPPAPETEGEPWREALHNMVVLARPYFRDDSQLLAIAEAERAMLFKAPSLPKAPETGVKLFFIANQDDQENWDLFVWANEPKQAVDLWCKHFDFSLDPTKENFREKITVFEIDTTAPAEPQPLDWHREVKAVLK